ncbi:MAG: DUF22 domain-containing protein [Archaeoglobaceae archaeon]
MMEEGIIKSRIQEILPKELSILGRWELIISDEDKRPLKGNFSLLRVRDIPIQPNSIVIFINIFKHYSAEVVDLLISEEGNKINTAVIYSESGRPIKRGEVIGVVKISDTAPKERKKILEVFRELNRKLGEIENGVGDSFIRSQWPIL